MSVSIGRPVLEVGSNIFELVEFVLVPEDPNGHAAAKNSFGVNVAKVREVIRMPEVVPCLTSCDAVLGVFNLRGHPIPVIHLAKAVGIPGAEIGPTAQIIVTEFSRRLAGFVVAGTKRIRRVSWDRVLPPSSETFGHITGMMLIENSKFIFILDFERILLEIEGGGQAAAPVPPGANYLATAEQRGSSLHGVHEGQKGKLVMVVDDSPTARRSLTDLLAGIGLQTVTYPNGEDAWAALKDHKSFSGQNAIGAIICDVEMPKLDGYSLVKRLKEDPDLKNLPFILHTSLSGQVNRDRAMESGADAYVAKFNKKEIAEALRRFLSGALREAG